MKRNSYGKKFFLLIFLGKKMGKKMGKKIIHGFFVSLIFPLTFLLTLPAYAGDDLSGVMQSVQSDFGASSTFVKLLYLLEIIAAVYTYHKTKNVAAMLGIVVISIFLTYALSHWVFTA